MVKKAIALAALSLAALGAPAAASAQLTGVGLEPYAGVSIPTGDLDDVASTGFTVGARLLAGIAPGISGYVGGDYQSFGVDDEVTGGEDVDVEISDVTVRAGAQLSVPTAFAGASPFLEAGVVMGKATIGASGDGASVEFESEWGFGFEAGAGVRFPVAPRVDLSLGGRYRNYSAEFEQFDEGEFGGNEADITYFSLTAGAVIRL